MPSLSASQIAAAQSLASGMSLIRSAKVAGVDRRTVQRWQKQEAFTREVRDRRALAAAGAALDEAKQLSPTGFDLAAAIADLRVMKEQTRSQVRSAGKSLLQKCSERLQDLPIEAITPTLLPQFFRVAQEFLQWADEEQARELALSELTERLLGPESVTAQKVHHETKKNITAAYDEIAYSPLFTDEQKRQIFELMTGG
jgi:hypothetical protein